LKIPIDEVIGGEPEPPETFNLGVNIPLSPDGSLDPQGVFAMMGSGEDITRRLDKIRAPQSIGGGRGYVHRGWRFDDLEEARSFRDDILAQIESWGWSGVHSFIQGRRGHFIDGGDEHQVWLQEQRKDKS